jgi:hypothetical protein
MGMKVIKVVFIAVCARWRLRGAGWTYNFSEGVINKCIIGKCKPESKSAELIHGIFSSKNIAALTILILNKVQDKGLLQEATQ